jgi:hypothetical protein
VTASRVAGLAAALLAGLGAPAAAQTLDLEARPSRVTVGDPVEVRVRVALPSGARLAAAVPRLAGPLPDGVRLLGTEPMVAAADGANVGTLRLAFFRPGIQDVPPIAVAYRTADGAEAEALPAATADVEVRALLPPGEQPWQDIKPLEPIARHRRLLLWLALPAGALGAAALVAARRPRPSTAPLPKDPAPDPLARALAELDALASRDADPSARVVAATDVLRRYLEAAAGLPAQMRTSAETLALLPARLAGAGGDARLRALLGEADLVKFAAVRPSSTAAARFHEAARALLVHWGARGVGAEPFE